MCGGCRQGVTINYDDRAELKAPMMDDDGNMIFPEGADVPVIEGFKPCEDNPGKLVPESDTACMWKMTGIMLQKDGSYKPLFVCQNKECSENSQQVTPATCAACPLRQKVE